jgi:phosphoheptose isomerase
MKTVNDAVEKAVKGGMTVVVAAGNSGVMISLTSPPHMPSPHHRLAF